MINKNIIGLDVETTSLDPTTGEIIEFAAIRYDMTSNQKIGEYTTLLKPKQPIPPEVTAITGITNEAVSEKEYFSQHIASIKQFIGNDTIFAHNAPFDLKYLSHHGLPLQNPIIDTFKLAGIAWPAAESYNLGLLVKQNNIEANNEHRASDDVEMTWQLLLEIKKRVIVKPRTFTQIKKILTKSNNQHYLNAFTEKENPDIPSAKPQKRPTKTSAEPDPHELSAMVNEVLSTLEEQKTCLIEANNNTKAKGYLTSILLHHANKENQPKGSKNQYLVSVFSQNLQKQFINETIPRLSKELNIKINTALIKERRKYICLSRLKQFLERESFHAEEAFLMIKLLLWLQRGGSGNIEDINLSHQAVTTIHYLHADSITCRQGCPRKEHDCPYYRALKTAQQSDLLITDHEYLPKMQTLKQRLFPRYLIIDEAHRLEESIRNSTQKDLSEQRLLQILSSIINYSKEGTAKLHQHITGECNDLHKQYKDILSNRIYDFIHDYKKENTLAITPTVRNNAGWKKIARHTQEWYNQFHFIIGLFEGSTTNKKHSEEIKVTIIEAKEFARSFLTFMTGNTDRIQWIEINNSYNELRTVITDQALRVKPIIESLISAYDGTILTSNTLTHQGIYDYIKLRTGINNCKTLTIKHHHTSYDQPLIYIVNDAPQPTGNDYINHLSNSIKSMSDRKPGNILNLFTSHDALLKTHAKLILRTQPENIQLITQGKSGGRHNIMNKIRHAENSIILCTHNFWYEISKDTNNISIMNIVKLPFSNPYDPVTTAVSEDENIDPFYNLQIPTTTIRLRQSLELFFEKDPGSKLAVIHDSRITHHSYGDTMINSLPSATIQIDDSANLIPTIDNWLGGNRT